MLALAMAALPGAGIAQEEARMVDLNVVAVDTHGQSVTDLTRDELQVVDSGKPQTIVFFHHRDSTLWKAPKLAPDEFSNRSGANVPRATVILFDLMNAKFATRGTATNQLVHDLQSLESADYLFLYLLTIDGRLYAVHGLPAVSAQTGEPDVPWTKGIKPLMDEAIRVVTRTRPVDMDVAVREQLTYFALNAIANQMARVPGRKSLVWLSDGVPIELGPNRSDTGDFVDFTPLLRQMSESFDRSGVAIYPVRLVMLGSPDNIDGANHSGMGSLDTLNEFAEITGGRPESGKDIAAAVRQAMRDMRTSYEIAYYPPAKTWDDKFHKLKVTCTRKGVHIQAKTGYFAWREAPGVRSEAAIESAVSTRFDAAEIGLRASLSRPPAAGNVVRLDSHIDAHDVLFVRAGDVYEGQIRLAVAGLGQDVRPERAATVPFQLHYSAQEYEKVLEQGIHFAQDVAVAPEIKSVRLIVFDRGSNSIGSVTVPLP